MTASYSPSGKQDAGQNAEAEKRSDSSRLQLLCGLNCTAEPIPFLPLTAIDDKSVECVNEGFIGSAIPEFTICESTDAFESIVKKSFGGNFGYNGLFNLSHSDTFSKDLKLCASTVAIVFSGVKFSRRSYVKTAQDIGLTENAKYALAQDDNQFFDSFGHGYVNAIYEGASYVVVLTFSSSSSEEARSFKSSTELEALFKSIKAGVNTDSEFEQITKRYGFQYKLHAEARGKLLTKANVPLVAPKEKEDLGQFWQDFQGSYVSPEEGGAVALSFEQTGYSSLIAGNREWKTKFDCVDTNLKNFYLGDDEFSRKPWTYWLRMLRDLESQHKKCMHAYGVYGREFVGQIEASRLAVMDDIIKIEDMYKGFKARPMTACIEEAPLSETFFPCLKNPKPNIRVDEKKCPVGSSNGGEEWSYEDMTGSPRSMLVAGRIVSSIKLHQGNAYGFDLVVAIEYTTDIVDAEDDVSRISVKRGGDSWKKTVKLEFTSEEMPTLDFVGWRAGTFVDYISLTFKDSCHRDSILAAGGSGGDENGATPFRDGDWKFIGFSGRSGHLIDRLEVHAVKLRNPFLKEDRSIHGC